MLDPIVVFFLFGAAALAVGAVALGGLLRGRDTKRATATLQKAVADGRDTPASLYPIIDPGLCIGSLSCVSACPEGDILGLVDGKAALIQGAHCIGHGRCALECPVDAIELVFGTQKRGVDLPETDAQFESARPGVYLIGEVGGMGLIKNCIKQGLQLAHTLKTRLSAKNAPRGSEAPSTDVAIVGAGPAGLALAAEAKRLGLRVRVLERDSVGGTIAHYPRQKLVMSEPVKLPGIGTLTKRTMLKEELLEAFDALVEKTGLNVEHGTTVTGIDGEPGAFSVQTSNGPVTAAAVVLAIGLRGTPRTLDVPGEDLPHVTYRLVDPDQYAGQAVLVVGGGDSAVEAAVQLAEDTDARVTLSYRKSAVRRAKPKNIKKLDALVAAGRITAAYSTVVHDIAKGKARLRPADVSADAAAANADGLTDCAADQVIICAGGQMPTAFLKAAGVRLKRYHAEAKAAGKDSEPVRTARMHGWLRWLYLLSSAALVAGLTAVFGDYYATPLAERAQHAFDASLKPTAHLGHAIGVLATVCMLATLLYVVRKRTGLLKGGAPIRSWIDVHAFFGLLAPALTAFHAAFQSNNALATLTWVGLSILSVTGIIGRSVYGWLPVEDGHLKSLDALRAEMAEAKLAAARAAARAEIRDGEPAAEMPTPSAVRMWLTSLVTRAETDEKDAPKALRRRAQNLQAQVAVYRTLRRLFGLWRGLHIGLAVFMFILIAGHIGLSLYLGYGRDMLSF